jgi:hypothetical protein
MPHNGLAVWLVKPPTQLAMKHKCKLALLTIPLVIASMGNCKIITIYNKL